MNNDQLINQDTGEKEWYTPPDVIEAARSVLGNIDLDPASCEEANRTVKAAKFYTKEDDGLTKQWFGNLWMNHPFSREFNAKWIAKICSEYERRSVSSACCISFASTSEGWFKPLMDYPQCFMTTRTRYTAPGNRRKPAPPKGSVVTYFGSNVQKFAEVFSSFGIIKIRFHS